MSEVDREEPPEWFADLSPAAQWALVRYGGYPEGWVTEPSPYTPELVTRWRESAWGGFLAPATLAPYYAATLGTTALRAGYLPGAPEMYMYGGRAEQAQARMMEYITRAATRPSAYNISQAQLWGAREAYWGAMETWAPAALGWGAMRLASFQYPQYAFIRAFGFPFYGAAQRLTAAGAMAPYVQAALGTDPTAQQRMQSTMFWPFQYQETGAALVSGLGTWTVAQTLMWGAGAGVTGGGFWSTLRGVAAVSLMQAGMGLMADPLATMGARYMAGMPMAYNEAERRQAFGQILMGGALTGAGIFAATQWGMFARFGAQFISGPLGPTGFAEVIPRYAWTRNLPALAGEPSYYGNLGARTWGTPELLRTGTYISEYEQANLSRISPAWYKEQVGWQVAGYQPYMPWTRRPTDIWPTTVAPSPYSAYTQFLIREEWARVTAGAKMVGSIIGAGAGFGAGEIGRIYYGRGLPMMAGMQAPQGMLDIRQQISAPIGQMAATLIGSWMGAEWFSSLAAGAQAGAPAYPSLAWGALGFLGKVAGPVGIALTTYDIAMQGLRGYTSMMYQQPWFQQQILRPVQAAAVAWTPEQQRLAAAQTPVALGPFTQDFGLGVYMGPGGAAQEAYSTVEGMWSQTARGLITQMYGSAQALLGLGPYGAYREPMVQLGYRPGYAVGGYPTTLAAALAGGYGALGYGPSPSWGRPGWRYAPRRGVPQITLYGPFAENEAYIQQAYPWVAQLPYLSSFEEQGLLQQVYPGAGFLTGPYEPQRWYARTPTFNVLGQPITEGYGAVQQRGILQGAYGELGYMSPGFEAWSRPEMSWYRAPVNALESWYTRAGMYQTEGGYWIDPARQQGFYPRVRGPGGGYEIEVPVGPYDPRHPEDVTMVGTGEYTAGGGGGKGGAFNLIGWRTTDPGQLALISAVNTYKTALAALYFQGVGTKSSVRALALSLGLGGKMVGPGAGSGIEFPGYHAPWLPPREKVARYVAGQLEMWSRAPGLRLKADMPEDAVYAAIFTHPYINPWGQQTYRGYSVGWTSAGGAEFRGRLAAKQEGSLNLIFGGDGGYYGGGYGGRGSVDTVSDGYAGLPVAAQRVYGGGGVSYGGGSASGGSSSIPTMSQLYQAGYTGTEMIQAYVKGKVWLSSEEYARSTATRGLRGGGGTRGETYAEYRKRIAEEQAAKLGYYAVLPTTEGFLEQMRWLIKEEVDWLVPRGLGDDIAAHWTWRWGESA